MRLGRSFGMLGLCLLLVGGCTGSPGEKGASGTGSSSPAVGDLSVEAMTRDGVLLKAIVHPIERVDDHVVLTVDCSFSGNAQSVSDTPLLIGSRFSSNSGIDQVSALRLVDFSSGRVWMAGSAGEDVSATTQGKLELKREGQSVTSVTFFGPVDVDSVDVLLPTLGLVRDVPVVEGRSGTPDLASLEVGDGPVEYAQPFELESLVQAYDGGASAQKQGDAQTVVMASDVLFASDVAELSSEAGARVDEVAEQIAQVADGGELHVVGHTDDVDTEEYNLDLSQRRAASVADRLEGVLGSSFTVVEEGKGESEPTVEGTDDQARAVNRRVEIEFTAAEAVTLPGEPADVPDATGPTGAGHEQVTYKVVADEVYTVEVPSVVRRNGYLVGTFVVTSVSGDSPEDIDFLSESRSRSGQREALGPYPGDRQTAKNVTLMGLRGRVFPARYWTRDMFGNPNVRILADHRLPGSLETGWSATYTVVWPDTGEDSVTVDSPDRFRITDIQVEEG